MTVWVPRFFHQCEVPNTSGLISPALCKMGSAQLLAYSTISPCCTKMRAGRSSWLCHGTMPPGSIVSLRKRKLAVLEVRRLLFEVDRTQSHVGYADRLEFDFLAGVGLHLAGGTFAGEG